MIYRLKDISIEQSGIASRILRFSREKMKLLDVALKLPFFFADTRTTNWLLMSSPFPTLFICLTYVFTVKVLGPKLMENRKPFQLRNSLIVYNFFQVIFSTWLFYEVRIHIALVARTLESHVESDT